MNPSELATKAALILDSKKARDIKVIKIEEVSALADYFVIASGTSNTQVQALADNLEMKMKEDGIQPYAVEGYRSNGWILLDYGTVFVHVFTTEARDFYDLDHLWIDGEEIHIDYPTE
ncbi:MAG: ribosome silencing factor [Clostridia bacterium]|nr:ribosome silencing factor [Clostridia bacterium]